MGVSLCVAGEIYVLERGLGGGLDACSGPIAVAHAPVQVSSTGALVTAFLEWCVVWLAVLITAVFGFCLLVGGGGGGGTVGSGRCLFRKNLL